MAPSHPSGPAPETGGPRAERYLRLSGTGRPPELSRRPNQGIGSRNMAVLVLGCAAATALLSATGILRAADSRLRSAYYTIRGAWTGQPDAVLVAIDRPTIATWGRPPWAFERHDDLVRAIKKDRPRLIAYLEPGPQIE